MDGWQASSTDPYVAPPAPLVRPGTTGVAPPIAPAIQDHEGLEVSPFNDNFFNNIPAEDVPDDDSQCVTLGR